MLLGLNGIHILRIAMICTNLLLRTRCDKQLLAFKKETTKQNVSLQIGYNNSAKSSIILFNNIWFEKALTYIQVVTPEKCRTTYNRLIKLKDGEASAFTGSFINSNNIIRDLDDQGIGTWYPYRLPVNGGIPVTSDTALNKRHPAPIAKPIGEVNEKMKSIPDKSNWYRPLPSAPYGTNCNSVTVKTVSTLIAVSSSISRKRNMGMDSNPAPTGRIVKITASRSSLYCRDNFECGEENNGCDRPGTNREHPALFNNNTEGVFWQCQCQWGGLFPKRLCNMGVKFQLLVAYKKEHNSSCVPYTYLSIREWVIE